MVDPQLDGPQLAALAAVVELGSFDAAAERLHVTPSAVSQRIKSLEQQVGQVLVVREKPCRATTAGIRLDHHPCAHTAYPDAAFDISDFQ